MRILLISALAFVMVFAGCATKTASVNALDTSNLGGVDSVLKTYMAGNRELREITGEIRSMETMPVMASSSSHVPLYSDISGKGCRQTKSHQFQFTGVEGSAIALVDMERIDGGPWRIDRVQIFSQDAWESFRVWLPRHTEQVAISDVLVASVLNDRKIDKAVGEVEEITWVEGPLGPSQILDRIEDDKTEKDPDQIVFVLDKELPGKSMPAKAMLATLLAGSYQDERNYTLEVVGEDGLLQVFAHAYREGDGWQARLTPLRTFDSAAETTQNPIAGQEKPRRHLLFEQ